MNDFDEQMDELPGVVRTLATKYDVPWSRSTTKSETREGSGNRPKSTIQHWFRFNEAVELSVQSTHALPDSAIHYVDVTSNGRTIVIKEGLHVEDGRLVDIGRNDGWLYELAEGLIVASATL